MAIQVAIEANAGNKRNEPIKKKRILERLDEESPRCSVIKILSARNVFGVLAQLLGNLFIFAEARNIFVFVCKARRRHENRPFADGCSTRRELLASARRADCEISNSDEILWQAERDGTGRQLAVQLSVADSLWRGRSDVRSS